VECMVRYGYKGRVYPINPNAREICGFKAYPSVLEVPEIADLAVMSVGRDRVARMFEQCVRAGIRRVIIISQGFGDADRRGAELQEQIVRLARENGVRVLGPNTMGILNNFQHFTTGFIDLPVPEKVSPVSVIAQTGVIQVASPSFTYQDWGKAIDIGNGCDVDFVDALEFFADDPETRVIVIHMEGIKRGREFLEIASKITLQKPVIVFKTGRSTVGAEAAVSHTGSLVGEDEVFDAAFDRAGIIRVKSGTELKDAIRALLLLQEMEGPRLGVLTPTGAGGIMSADACEDFGLVLAKLPPGLSEELKEGVPEWIHIGNPIDIWPVGMIGGNLREVYGKAMTGLLKSPGVDGALAVIPAPSSPLHAHFGIAEAVAGARREAGNRKPIAMWVYMDDIASATKQYESIGGVACFDSIEQAVRGLSFCHRYYQARRRNVPSQKSFSVDRQRMKTLLEKGREQKVLLGEDALKLLAAFKIPVVKGALARGWEELEAAAADLKYPLVLKLAGSAFLHKSEWGGVITGIETPNELRDAFHKMTENVRLRNPDIRIGAFQLQEQAGGLELLFGLKRDPQFGQVIACGLGGIYTEVFRDVSREIVPVDRLQAEQMLKSLKMYPLLTGVRGEAGVKMEALLDALERLSFLAAEIPDIAELDINPLMATGDGCRAVDARILW
ncbi:MAG: acetate--CoA ligase family protein, partial [Proteobacteria bacterium]|nr:acetate--CoA ligase family protein [Pseudomonadota bacterium]